MRNRSQNWTEEAITNVVLKVCAAQGHFPCNSVFLEMGYGGMLKAMYNFGGTRKWWKKAEALGFSKKPSDTYTGQKAECLIAEKLVKAGFNTALCPFKSHCDLVIAGVLRVDVKSAEKFSYARMANGTITTGWFFHFGKKSACDLIALFRRDLNDVFWVPWFILPESSVTLGESTKKYAKWHENFSIVNKMLKWRLEEKAVLC